VNGLPGVAPTPHASRRLAPQPTFPRSRTAKVCCPPTPAPLATAASAYAEAWRPLPRAQALESAGVLQATQGNLADARQPFAGAMNIYSDLEAAWDIARVRGHLREHGIRARAKAHTITGWAALTKTEAKVAELIAAGKSNPEIAAVLTISSRTVEVHASRILAKLQVRSRVDVARLAADRTLRSTGNR
jgi:DNA-binding CsgD family transcriptional regulator